MKKVIDKVSALFQFDLITRSHDKLLDSTASVYVFNIKERFSNFKRVLKGQGPLCGSNVISIKASGQISLSLKMKIRIKLLTQNNLAYISNFLLNLISLGCLQKRGFDYPIAQAKYRKTIRLLNIPGSTATTMKLAMTRMVRWLLPPMLKTKPPRKTLDHTNDHIPLQPRTSGIAEWAISARWD